MSLAIMRFRTLQAMIDTRSPTTAFLVGERGEIFPRLSMHLKEWEVVGEFKMLLEEVWGEPGRELDHSRGNRRSPALAELCSCDPCPGVHGSGVRTALGRPLRPREFSEHFELRHRHGWNDGRRR